MVATGGIKNSFAMPAIDYNGHLFPRIDPRPLIVTSDYSIRAALHPRPSVNPRLANLLLRSRPIWILTLKIIDSIDGDGTNAFTTNLIVNQPGKSMEIARILNLCLSVL